MEMKQQQQQQQFCLYFNAFIECIGHSHINDDDKLMRDGLHVERTNERTNGR
jgi:hypothetical protein